MNMRSGSMKNTMIETSTRMKHYQKLINGVRSRRDLNRKDEKKNRLPKIITILPQERDKSKLLDINNPVEKKTSKSRHTVAIGA